MRKLLLHVSCASILLSCLASNSLAAWYESSSDHFLIYADNSKEEIRKFSERLERYHKAMSAIFPSNKEKPSPSNRVTIFVVDSMSAVQELYSDTRQDSRFVGGFYVPRAGSSVAFIPAVDISSNRNETSWSEHSLMHEYAHHFMFLNAPYLLPRWFTEGFAEYFSTAKHNTDGSIGLGLPSTEWVYQLKLSDTINVTLEQLLNFTRYKGVVSRQNDNFYARSWLLFHYMYSDNDRKKALVNYLNRLNHGEGALESAKAAFGDFAALEKQLWTYQNKSSWPTWKVGPDGLSAGPIEVRELNKAEAASMPVRIRSKRGVDKKRAGEVVIDARKLATQYPEEPEVQAALAEAEVDDGNSPAAIEAADKALAVMPTHMNALIQKGYALLRIATETKDPADWLKARRHFVAVNKIEQDNPIPLFYYYITFYNQGEKPTEAAIIGLQRALELAPFDSALRLVTAQQEMTDKRYAGAINILMPLTNDAHRDADSVVLKMLEEARKGLADNRAN